MQTQTGVDMPEFADLSGGEIEDKLKACALGMRCTFPDDVKFMVMVFGADGDLHYVSNIKPKQETAGLIAYGESFVATGKKLLRESN
jgi:hypothetical protein